MDQLSFGLLVLRVVFGVFLAYHGYNKVTGPNGLGGTAAWFGAIGMRWPRWQARLAATTEIGAGLLFAAGLLTWLAAAGIIGVMVVAIVVAHWKVGFFIFKPNQGWEYCASIAVVAAVVATTGPGEWSLDHAWDLIPSGWTGGLLAVAVGVGGAVPNWRFLPTEGRLMTPPMPDVADRPQGRTWVKALLALGCALMAAMWGYYLFLAPDKGVYQLDDRTWRVEAKAVCNAARAELDGLASTDGGFIEEPTVEQMQARAAIVDEATAILDDMVDDLMAIPVDNDRDRAILEVFETHYRMVIADRRRYSAALANGENVRYTETIVKEAGGPVSNVVTDFTAGVKGNDVPECSPPNDLVNTKAP